MSILPAPSENVEHLEASNLKDHDDRNDDSVNPDENDHRHPEIS